MHRRFSNIVFAVSLVVPLTAYSNYEPEPEAQAAFPVVHIDDLRQSPYQAAPRTCSQGLFDFFTALFEAMDEFSRQYGGLDAIDE